MEFRLGSFKDLLPIEDVQTWIVDPPYNIKFNYKNSSFKDNLQDEEYEKLMFDMLEMAFDSTRGGGLSF